MHSTKTLQRRHEDLLVDAGRRAPSTPTGADCLLAQLGTQGHYPTSAQQWYYFVALDLTGEETEGSAGTTDESTVTGYAWNSGTTVPPPNTIVLVTNCDGRWAFHYDA